MAIIAMVKADLGRFIASALSAPYFIFSPKCGHFWHGHDRNWQSHCLASHPYVQAPDLFGDVNSDNTKVDFTFSYLYNISCKR